MELITQQRRLEANTILTGHKLTECINEACSITGCTTKEDWQDAYYKMFGNKTACSVALYKLKPEYLKNKVPYPRSKYSYSRTNVKFFEQEGLNYKDLKTKYLSTKFPETKPSKYFKIPAKLNFVFVTSKKEFETAKNNFFKINAYLFHNTKITPHWQHTVWTNNIDYIPISAKKKLSAKKIKLRSINEFDMKDPKHKALKTVLNKYATQHKWGLASDIARSLVQYYEGGVYVDGDYQILKPVQLEKYMKNYRSFFGINDFNPTFDLFEVINAFIASEPKGKVIGKHLDLLYRNTVDIVNAPNYVKYPCNKSEETIIKTSVPLTVAFALMETESDTLLPYCSLFQMDDNMHPCINKEKLGKHHFHGGWTRDHDAMIRPLIY